MSKKGKSNCHTAYFISNLDKSAEFFHSVIRNHWGIENKLHWVKDVIHNEDKNKIRTKNGAQTASILSTISLNLHRKNGAVSITKNQIKFGADLSKTLQLLRT